jgi:UrcA family protein
MRVPLFLAAAALTAAAALPAAAQVYTYDDGVVVDEVIVSPIGPYRSGPNRMSQRVSYADLDLTTYSDRQVLAQRVRIAAHNVCRALRESPGGSCVDQAIRDARPQMRVAFAEQVRTRAYAYNDLYSPY